MHKISQQPQTGLPMGSSVTLVASRRERALALGVSEDCRRSFGRFCAALERLGCLTPVQLLLAKKLARVTLWRGRTGIDFASVKQLMRLEDGRGPFCGFSAPAVSLAMNGNYAAGERVVQMGLRHYGIVLVEERSCLEAGLARTVWSVVADWRQWSGVPADGWREGPADEASWVRQLEASSRWPTGPLPGLAREPDLKDALVSLPGPTDVPRAVCGAGAGPVRDARLGASEGRARSSQAVARSGCAEGHPARSGADARPRGVTTPEGTGVSGSSECLKMKSLRKAVGVQRVGTPCARVGTVKQEQEREHRTVQPLNCSSDVNRQNGLLRELRVEFARAHGEAKAADEMARSGIHWRMVARDWPAIMEEETSALRAHINEGGKFSRGAWFMVNHYILRRLGEPNFEAARKNLKESF